MATNSQKPSTPWFDSGGKLRVHSLFPTLQGEGPWAGTFALFVRLYGCNLQCPLCDTDYTSQRCEYTPGELLKALTAIEPAPPLVVITGGEPFLQNLCPFLTLCQKSLPKTRIQIETNGTIFSVAHERCFRRLSVPPAVVCSPKLDRVEPRLLPFISALKYIGREGQLAGDDGLPVQSLGHPVKTKLFRPEREQQRQMHQNGLIFLQPEDSGDRAQNRRNLRACTQSALQHRLRLGVQVHKLSKLP